MRRNPTAPVRDRTDEHRRKTQDRIEQYYGLVDLLRAWETTDDTVQVNNHGYILKLRARIRNVRNYIDHRAGPDSDLVKQM